MRTDFASDKHLRLDDERLNDVRDFARQPALFSLIDAVSSEIDKLQKSVMSTENSTAAHLNEIEVIITGHSLGGAVATLFANQMAYVLRPLRRFSHDAHVSFVAPLDLMRPQEGTTRCVDAPCDLWKSSSWHAVV